MAGHFQANLRSNEHILWQDSPRQGVVFRKADILLVPFSLLWGGFAIFWEGGVIYMTGAQADHASQFMALWGIPFVLVGLYLIFGRFIADAWVRGGTRYALTNERALIERTRMAYALNSIELRGKTAQLSGLSKDGSGTIDLGDNPFAHVLTGRFGAGIWMPWLGATSFEGIKEAQSVFRQVQGITGAR